MLESRYKARLIETLQDLFPGCEILKNDEQLWQGIPDMLILYGSHWAMLEVKKSKDAPNRPNQDYWVEHFDRISFAAFIYPENEQEVLNDLQQAFRHSRAARVS